jgi:hypothetical protein
MKSNFPSLPNQYSIFERGNYNDDIVSKEIKAEIGEIVFLSYFLAKRVKSQRGRN